MLKKGKVRKHKLNKKDVTEMANVGIALKDVSGIVLKDVSYDFQKDHYYEMARNEAIKAVKEVYLDEQKFERDEFEKLNAASYEEYCEAVGKKSTDIDYRKSFEDNISHPVIAQQIEDKINRYMRNIFDLPKNLVLTVDDNKMDIRNPDESVIRSFIKEKFGDSVEFRSYERAAKAEEKDIFAQLSYDKVGEMIKSKDFQTFLNLRASIEKYSFNNIALLYTQKPDIKAVMGMTAWNKNGRKIAKGSKSLKIWKPLKKALTDEKQVDEYISYHYTDIASQEALEEKDKLMKKIEADGKVEIRYGYTLISVFDVSSTIPKDGTKDNLDEILQLNKPLNKDLKNYDEIMELMTESAFAVPFTERDGDSEQDALFGSVYDFTDKLLSQKPDAVKGIKNSIPLEGDMHTIESVMSTYLICKHIGIDCEDKAGFKLSEIFNKDFTRDMIRLGKREMFMKCFDRAYCVADQFNANFNKKFQTLELYKAVRKSFKDMYKYLYNHNDNVDGYYEALDYGDYILSNMPKEAEGVIKYLWKTNVDFVSSDREVAALALALVANNVGCDISPLLEHEVLSMQYLIDEKAFEESTKNQHKMSKIDIDC